MSDVGKHAVRQLLVQIRQVLDDHGKGIPRAELWNAAGVTQTLASQLLTGKTLNRLVIARIAEALCRSSSRARIFVASTKTRRDIRQALERALPALEHDAPQNVRRGLAEIRQRLHLLGQE